jgi:predicted exporter
MALLAGVMAVAYAFEAVSGELLTFFAAVSLQLGLYFVLWIGFEYARFFRGPAARPAADVTAHDSVGPGTRVPRL